ncbi:hypothetical protein IFT36_05985 [Frigoribacterium sp. CFBP 13605]|jgi:hypothetical protein|uniref:hypothetical protein n=1 Tax=unclassified Frigoribacterium TaxID=2627005 RepID=UPI000F47D2E2|nr:MULTISPECIES: hypothetical protein [unclassified Frigoribacterium]MBD8140097.1 hypothetical protein [Frigoribacterium sp. CFBP 13605]ROS57534.1 hypothetical protein EDF21_1198 [Frigoribacterium sp. PhB118]
MDTAEPDTGRPGTNDPSDAALVLDPTATVGTVRTTPARPARIRRERATRLRRPATFVLSWLDLPNDGSDPTLPLGTCLVLRTVGRPARDVLVDLPGGPVRGRDKLRPGAPLGIATPVELDALVALGTVFVEWSDAHGVSRTTWLRVPPVPARYRSPAAH